MKRASLLVAMAFAALCFPATASAAGGGGSDYGCFFCEVRCYIEGCETSCAVPLPDTWGEGIKCQNTRLGCFTSGGACLYVVVNGAKIDKSQLQPQNGRPREEQAPANRIDCF